LQYKQKNFALVYFASKCHYLLFDIFLGSKKKAYIRSWTGETEAKVQELPVRRKLHLDWKFPALDLDAFLDVLDVLVDVLEGSLFIGSN
jgi:hypothetical protein